MVYDSLNLFNLFYVYSLVKFSLGMQCSFQFVCLLLFICRKASSHGNYFLLLLSFLIQDQKM